MIDSDHTANGAWPERVCLVGGRHRDPALVHENESWYDSGVILELDLASGKMTQRVLYQTPPGIGPAKNPLVTFKSATIEKDVLHVVTELEVLEYALPEYRLLTQLSLPCFNDNHHVLPSGEGTRFVAVTGLDMVLEIDAEGRRLNQWPVIGADLWRGCDDQIDYRQIRLIKPHLAHPNHLFFDHDRNLWVTRFHQRDAIMLSDHSQRIGIDIQSPHDGYVVGDQVWFTTIDGHLVTVDLARREKCAVHDLNRYTESDQPLGWCRGVLVLDEDHVLVGFSRLRGTRLKENLRWAMSRIRGGESNQPMPTRICLYKLSDGIMLREFNTEDHGMGVIFSILAL